MRRCFSHIRWLLVLCVCVGCAPKVDPNATVPLIEVTYVVPSQREILEYKEFTGRTEALEKIDIRARVSGYLDKIHFRDGATIEQGQPLFTIDDRSYAAEVERARATVTQMQARYERLKLQETRSAQLIQTKALSQDQHEKIVYDTKECAAELSAAQANLKVAELYVQFTKIVAPISGKISRRLVDERNLVKADDTLLTTMVATDTLYVYFNVDERTVLKLQRLQRNQTLPPPEREVEIGLADETDFTHRGIVDFKDVQIDPATGTLRYRARIDNRQNFLNPGMFVRIRFPIGEKYETLLVPEEALASDQGQRYLYLVDKANKIEYRRVETGILENGQRVIRSGLDLHERVVVTGLQRIRPQMEVTPLKLGETSTTESSPKSKAEAPQKGEAVPVKVAAEK